MELDTLIGGYVGCTESRLVPCFTSELIIKNMKTLHGIYVDLDVVYNFMA